MRLIYKILFILLLALSMVATVIGWERYRVTPQLEQAQHWQAMADTDLDELPAECVAELASMGTSSEESPTRRADASRSRSIVRQADVQPHNLQGPQLVVEPEISPAVGNDKAEPIKDTRRVAAGNQATRISANEPQDPPSRTVTLPVTVEEASDRDRPVNALHDLDPLEVMRQLRSQDSFERSQARSELRRRGYGEVDLELARQLFSPDAEARKQLARTVPRLESIDASRWLLWLALDPEPEVRMAAITMLATTGDPALLERVEAIAAKDSDAQIQSLGAQIAKQREMASSRGETNSQAGRRSGSLR